jgi:hypothetical protein
LSGAATPAAAPVDPLETAALDAAVAGETAALDHLPTIDQANGEEVPTADTADFLAAIEGEPLATGSNEPLPTIDGHDEQPAEGNFEDSWLTTLVAAGTDTHEWEPTDIEDDGPVAPLNGSARAHAPAPSDEPSFAALLSDSEQGEPVDASDWDMPEQPQPPSMARAASGANEDLPHWGEEAVDNIVSVVPPVTHIGNGVAPTHGYHEKPHDSVVMRVRTTNGTGPVVARPASAMHPVQRQTAQLATLTAMVEADPQNHLARLTLAVAYVSGRLPEQALTEYRRLIRESEELLPEVVERLKEMIADGDAPARAHRVLGDAYMKMGQFDLAMAEFQRALSARPRVAK